MPTRAKSSTKVTGRTRIKAKGGNTQAKTNKNSKQKRCPACGRYM